MSRITTSRSLAALAALLTIAGEPARAQQPVEARSLSLTEALRVAVTASEEVGIARASTERARGEQLRARSALFPQIYASAGYTRTLASQF